MKILPFITPLRVTNNSNQNQNQNTNPQSTPPHYEQYFISNGYNDYLLNFTSARVDKGLERFYNVNKNYMPITVRNYVENLDYKSKITPMEAQRNAYKLLYEAETIGDIKNAYPEEPLFRDLINPPDSHATRGILNFVRNNDELLNLYGKGVLKDKSNLTVYLVKKIFLENKTLNEINEDLEKDLDEDFKASFNFNKDDVQYIYPGTLSALGIKPPKFEYRQSLRYTIDGYSDYIGDKISAYWDTVPDEKKKKCVQNFETWWNSLTQQERLDMIAKQNAELEMLKKYKTSIQAERKKQTLNPHQQNSQPKNSKNQTAPVHKHVKIGSTSLKEDELFIKWASNNLKIYEEKLPQADKNTVNIKRVGRIADDWNNMSYEEQTDCISGLKSGHEPQRYTMIDAWNHSLDLIKDLSVYLQENQIYKPTDLLYSSQEFSKFQSRIMTEFWQTHPEHSWQLGENIRQSKDKIQDAISQGIFLELQRQIMDEKEQRIKELEKFKFNKKAITNKTDFPGYMAEFKSTYYRVNGHMLKNLPQQYIDDYFKVIFNGFSKEHIEAWTRNMKGETAYEDEKLLSHIMTTEPPGGAEINRALEAALADTLYACTGNPSVYKLSHSDLKIALYQIDRGEDVVKIYSNKLGQSFEFPIVKKRIDKKRIASLYNAYIKPLNIEDIQHIAFEYFTANDGHYIDLIAYMSTYRNSLKILFSDYSVYPKSVRQAMLEKFKMNCPQNIEQNHKCLLFDESATLSEKEIAQLKFMFARRFSFVPQSYMQEYTMELGKCLRNNKAAVDFKQLELACQKRKDIFNKGKLFILPKPNFGTKNLYTTFAMEEVLADVLYEATNNILVYKLGFEELCDNIELFSMVKKFPCETRYYTSQDGTNIELTAFKRPNTNQFQLQKKYNEYLDEIKEWFNIAYGKNNTFTTDTLEDLLYILNPDENMPEKDNMIRQKLCDIFLHHRQNGNLIIIFNHT